MEFKLATNCAQDQLKAFMQIARCLNMITQFFSTCESRDFVLRNFKVEQFYSEILLMQKKGCETLSKLSRNLVESLRTKTLQNIGNI